MEKIKARPILFSGPMVNAILDGRKTQTRRQLKRVEGESFYAGKGCDYTPIPLPTTELMRQLHLDNILRNCPYGKVGDLLWVRETFGICHRGDSTPGGKPYDPDILYRATDIEPDIPERLLWEPFKWKPSIFMPKKLSRITLKITDIRVERLQDISENDALAEGVQQDNDKHSPPPFITAKENFQALWNSINKNWKENPWVWVLEFSVINQNFQEYMEAA